jgi:hypothetical protein
MEAAMRRQKHMAEEIATCQCWVCKKRRDFVSKGSIMILAGMLPDFHTALDSFDVRRLRVPDVLNIGE